jgi:hypothetical protein
MRSAAFSAMARTLTAGIGDDPASKTMLRHRHECPVDVGIEKYRPLLRGNCGSREAPGFEQHHGGIRILGQAGGKDRTGGPAPYHYIVGVSDISSIHRTLFRFAPEQQARCGEHRGTTRCACQRSWTACLTSCQGRAAVPVAARPARRLRCSLAKRMAIEPSPTAEATRFTELLRTSPTANTPGRLASSK